MSKYRNNYKYTLNKSLKQNQDLLDQTFRRAMNKFGIDYSDKSTNRYDFNTSYRSNCHFNNTEHRKAYPVLPTYTEQSNNQVNSPVYSQYSASHKIEFDVKSSVKGTGNRYNYRSINNNSYLNTSSTYGSPNKPTTFFQGYQSRKDLLENIEKTQKVSPEKRNYEYSPSKYTPSKYTPSKYTPILTASPNQGSVEKNSPQANILLSSPERLHYLSLDEHYQNQENNKKTPIQSNDVSPSSNRNNYLSLQKDAFNQDLRKKASLQSNQYSPSRTEYYNYKFSTISSKNKVNNQEPSQKHNNMNLKPNHSESTSQAVSKISKFDAPSSINLKPAKNKLEEKDSKVPLELDSRNKPEIPTSLPVQTNKLPQESNLPAKAPSPIQENKSPAFSAPTETNKHSSTTQMNTEKDATSLPASSKDNLVKPTAPPPVSDMPNINEDQSLNPNNIESLKNQTEFLDQVEKSMKEDAKEDTNTILVERLKQYNNTNSEDTPTINTSSPIKSSPNKSSPTKSSPNKSSPNKSSPNKSSPNKSSPNKSSSNNSFESPSSFKSTENNNNDSDFDTDIDIEISFEKSNSDFDVILYKEEEEYNEDDIIPNKTVRADSYQFPKMLDLICTQDFFIKPKIKFMIENTIDLADKMTSDALKGILIHE